MINKELIYRTEPDFPFLSRASCPVDVNQLTNVRLGIPKKGELAQGAISYLSLFGWQTSPFETGRRLTSHSPVRNNQVFALKDSDLIKCLEKDSIDIAILGADKILESQLDGIPIIPLKFLGFGECNFCLGFPFTNSQPPLTNAELKTVLEKSLIATSLPASLVYLLNKSGFPITPKQIIPMAGSVEIAPELFGTLNPDQPVIVADIVSSGETCFSNGIRPDMRLITFPGAYLVTNKNYLEAYEN